MIPIERSTLFAKSVTQTTYHKAAHGCAQHREDPLGHASKPHTPTIQKTQQYCVQSRYYDLSHVQLVTATVQKTLRLHGHVVQWTVHITRRIPWTMEASPLPHMSTSAHGTAVQCGELPLVALALRRPVWLGEGLVKIGCFKCQQVIHFYLLTV